ncbi:MAG: hypothetical protein MR350_01125 [Alphaproteobacteria bacterium]|nr:hypothetical protein [Alphaproteobacteria bacterium]
MDMDFALFQQVIGTKETEKNVAARFYDKAVKTNEVADNGLPVFKNVTYIEIRLKDNNTEVFDQPATADKIRRFPQEYALYKLSKKQTENGTPLEQFAFLTAAEIATCKSRGVFTVETLAGLDFDKVQSLGLQDEHVLAQMFLEKSENNKMLDDFAKKELEYEREIETLREQLAAVQRALSEERKKHSSAKAGEK